MYRFIFVIEGISFSFFPLHIHASMDVSGPLVSSPSGPSVNVGPSINVSGPSMNVSGPLVSSPSGPSVNVSGPLVSSPSGLCTTGPLMNLPGPPMSSSSALNVSSPLVSSPSLVLSNWFTSHFHLVCLAICLPGRVLPIKFT